MIPVRLSLRNFMSYGDDGAVLDFSGMHLACLSGDNGNGKSALLDAITWALWGKTRASGSQSSGDDDLVRLGADEMEVSFEFLLGDDAYRVLRKRNRRARSGEWQLYSRNPDGSWRPCGGPTMRETEKALSRLLHMEYETFLNSAYIQQGRADEFTRQKPDDRKRILADVLDLGRYDALERMAREHRSEADLALSDVEGEIRHLQSRADEGPALRQRLAEQEADSARLDGERAACEERLSAAQAQQAALQEKAQRLQEREERLKEVEGELAERRADIARLQAKAAENAALLGERDAIARDQGRLCELRAVIERLEPSVADLQRVERDYERVRGLLSVRRQEVLGTLKLAEVELRQVEERERKVVEFRARLADLAPKLQFLEQAEKDHQAAREALAAAQEAFADLQAQHRRLDGELKETEEVLALLSEPRPACPVCQSDLSGGRRDAVVTRQEGKRRALQERLRDLKREGVAARQERERQEAEVRRLEAQLRGAAALRAQAIEWTKASEETIALNEAAADVPEHVARLRHCLEAEDYGAEERAELARLSQDAQRLRQADQEHASAQTEAHALVAANVEGRYAQLQEAERGLAGDEAEIERLQQWLAKRMAQVSAERERQAAMRGEVAGLAAAREALAGAEEFARAAASSADTAREQAAHTRSTLEDCARAAEQLKTRKAERDRLQKDKQAYAELIAAFGRKGVQALIIENALPEIQDEANRLLARLTDNAMQVSLHSTRAHRSGAGQSETLDIRITDDSGTRPYEMYSGGEAFRVNFALRIALSRVLARRAGARLQTLILDEGFGTQDAKGRERLVEAIGTIQDEFALILVVSHIEELKDAFPTRIEIVRGPGGSQINVLD